jgi:hypothetical protein
VPAIAVVAIAARAREMKMDFMVEDRCVVVLMCENFARLMVADGMGC